MRKQNGWRELYYLQKKRLLLTSYSDTQQIGLNAGPSMYIHTTMLCIVSINYLLLPWCDSIVLNPSAQWSHPSDHQGNKPIHLLIITITIGSPLTNINNKYYCTHTMRNLKHKMHQLQSIHPSNKPPPPCQIIILVHLHPSQITPHSAYTVHIIQSTYPTTTPKQ